MMDITWYGHSCFKIKGKKATVITDPFSPDLGYTLGKQTANIVTVSHQHPGHSYIEGIDNGYKAVKAPGEYEISGVLIVGITAFHDAQKGEKRGKNNVFLMDIDEVSVCHLGDLGHSFTPAQIEQIDNVDILLLPVGGVSTIDATTAAEIVRQIEPQIVIPMHYKTDAIKRELAPVDNFLKEMGQKEVEPQANLSITKANLPLTTQVVVLSY